MYSASVGNSIHTSAKNLGGAGPQPLSAPGAAGHSTRARDVHPPHPLPTAPAPRPLPLPHLESQKVGYTGPIMHATPPSLTTR
jgi:hypothetical protein